MRRNVLVVDDDLGILELVSFFLEHSGFFVKTCKDGHSALDELNSNPYDLVILDISLPHMNGIKTLKTIRDTPAIHDIPVIMLTSSQNKEDILAAKKNQVTDYLIKPPTREAFLNRVDLVLGGRPQFEVIQLDENEPITQGSFSLPIKLKSISKNGIVIIGDVPIHKGSSIKIENLELFKTLQLQRNEFKVTDCIATDKGHFEYFISLMGLSKPEHERIREWIMTESYKQKKYS